MPLTLEIVTPEARVYSDTIDSVVIPTVEGEVGILPGHAPMLALMGSGPLSVDRPGGGSDSFHVAGGVLKVERDTVTLLTEYAGDQPPAEVPASSIVFAEDVE